MLDVEFISELAVAMLHGPQNKKQSLDKYYALYENTFDDAKHVKETFRKVAGELVQSVGQFSKTRWRKKSDFYTLFLIMARRSGALPLNQARRQQLKISLVRFGNAVDAILRDVGTAKGKTANVKAYASSVERAASDLANRKARETALEAELGPIFGP